MKDKYFTEREPSVILKHIRKMSIGAAARLLFD